MKSSTRQGRGVPRRWLAAAVAAALALAAFAAGCGSSSSAGPTLKGDGHHNVDQASTRSVRGQINRSTVAGLKQAWTLPLSAKSSFGAYASTPLIVNGVIYLQDLMSNVRAVDLENGEEIWSKAYEEADLGPNGVVIAEGKVFGATASRAFALDQETGEEVWSRTLTVNSGEGIDMAPGYDDGLVYISTVPTDASARYPGGGVGTLWALDAGSGKPRWKFATVPRDLWGNKRVNGGGGLWYPPSFDGRGFMYFGTGNPSPFPGAPGHPWGSSRPGPNLYTNSMLKMNAKTGKLVWHHQVTPHDVYDWDFQNSPILLEAGGRQLAIGSGKSGIVVALDRRTGKPVWERKVGTHNGHDDDGLLAMRGEYGKLKPGSEVYPGTLGGVIVPAAANKSTVFVPVVEHPIEASESGDEVRELPQMRGLMVALDAATGKVKWQREFESAAFGPPTVVNDLVFFATFDGIVHALDVANGSEVWQAQLPAASNSGLMASGDTLVATAGLAGAEGQVPSVVAYRLED